MKDDGTTRQWLIRAADCIAASADWFAEVKNVPKSEMRRHYRICEEMHDALSGAPPPKRHPRKFDEAHVMNRLRDVVERLRERVGES